nr:IS701 family transposase [Streptomyces sp. H34-S4]
MGEVAGCFPRRETRRTFREMTEGLLMELQDVNCWTVAEEVGHPGPHRLQHLLSRASWDDRAVLDQAAAWAVQWLDDGEGVLIADETGDEKSSTDAVGAGHQYSGSLGGIGLCQVAVHLSFASNVGHTVIDRALYLPRDWAGDEERRELTGVPEDLLFATKPQLAAALLTKAVADGIRATVFAADEVYGSREVRRTCRALGLGYAIAVRSNHKVTTPGGAGTVLALGVAGSMLAAVPAQAAPMSDKAIAHQMIKNPAQFAAFNNIVSRESGWNHTATNASSGAYGLVQALPASKMASAGSDWKTNPATQIKWGLDYMNSRYGSPVGAWNFWQTHHWY